MSTITPPSGLTVALGRNRPPARHPRVRFGDRVDLSGLPTPQPTGEDYTGAAGPILADVLGNDTVGDCTCACAVHVQGVCSGNAGKPLATTAAQTLDLYGSITGYTPNDPSTDQGADEVTVLNYLCEQGFPNGERALGWCTVDATNQQECKAAIEVLENLCICLELPDDYLHAQMPSGDGFVWGVAGDPVPANGHCIAVVGYTPEGVVIDTWGLIGVLSWAALARYCVPTAGGACYALLLASSVSAQGSSPMGASLAQLMADFAALGGTLAPTST
jgi:hypothetical protein